MKLLLSKPRYFEQMLKRVQHDFGFISFCFKTSLLLLLLAHSALFAQHTPQYSQYMFNGLALNPAYAGSREVFTTSLLYRSQWSRMEGAPVTQTFSAHAPLKNEKIGVGFLFVNDKTGVTSNKTINTNYAYRLPLGKGKLSMGLSGGVILTQSRWQEITTDETGDPSFASNSPIQVLPGFGTGLYYYTDKFFAGISSPSLLSYSYRGEVAKAKTDFSRASYLVTAGYLIGLSDDVKLKPSVLLKYNPSGPPQLDLNGNVIFHNALWVGLSYRTNDAVIALLEYEIDNKLKLGYAYDYTLSAFKGYTGGAHELMIRYEFGYKIEAKNPRFF